MKNLKLTGLGLGLLLCCAVTSAQEIPLNEPDLKKPLLFADLPDRIPVETASLERLVNNETGINVQMKLSGSRIDQFSGKVVSNAVREDRSKSVVIRSSNFNGASMTISLVKNEAGETNYVGRIISFQHGDVFELQNIDGQYFFVKRKFYDLINE